MEIFGSSGMFNPMQSSSHMDPKNQRTPRLLVYNIHSCCWKCYLQTIGIYSIFHVLKFAFQKICLCWHLFPSPRFPLLLLWFILLRCRPGFTVKTTCLSFPFKTKAKEKSGHTHALDYRLKGLVGFENDKNQKKIRHFFFFFKKLIKQDILHLLR